MRLVRMLGALAALYVLVVRGNLTLDLGLGRRVRPLGPLARRISAPREVVFDAIAAPYLGRTSRALGEKLAVWERGTDMVLAAHFTRVGASLEATTLETVRFDRPNRISFRLVRGPVPHLAESFELSEDETGTELTWSGEIGTDLWAFGVWWGGRVGRVWEAAVGASLDAVKQEAERRAR
jgi:polyketide cyclase/dehydrase/lipid transport protein